jgi:small subunit ribosomal protein S8
MVNDPIADMLTRIRNAAMARHTQVVMPSSKMKVAIAKILREEGFIQDFDVNQEKPQPALRIRLKYTDQRKCVVSGLERVSSPGRRVYGGTENLKWVKSGMGIAILTTSKGVMTDRKARRMHIGGEVLCYVW